MADITFNCPNCNQALEAPSEMTGQVINCPACKKSINVPQRLHVQPLAYMASSSSIPQPEKSPEENVKLCHFCGEEILATAIKCKHCGSMLDGTDTKGKATLADKLQAKPFCTVSGKIKSIICFIAALFFIICLISYHPLDPSFTHYNPGNSIQNLTGSIGSHTADTLIKLMGIGILWLPVMLLLAGVRYFREPQFRIRGTVIVGLIGLVFTTSGMVALLIGNIEIYDVSLHAGGLWGKVAADLLYANLGIAGSLIILGLTLISSLMILIKYSPMISLFRKIDGYLKAKWQGDKSSNEASFKNSVPIFSVTKTKKRQGAVVGGWVCLLLGAVLMMWTMSSFILFLPLFIASFIMGIVSIAQSRILNGILILLLSVIVPIVIAYEHYSNYKSPKYGYTDSVPYKERQTPRPTPTPMEPFIEKRVDSYREVPITIEETDKPEVEVIEDFYGYNSVEHCKNVSAAMGGSYMIENSCRKQEQENKKKLDNMEIPLEIKKYCKQVGEAMGGSYMITASCVRQEIEAKSKLK